MNRIALLEVLENGAIFAHYVSHVLALQCVQFPVGSQLIINKRICKIMSVTSVMNMGKQGMYLLHYNIEDIESGNQWWTDEGILLHYRPMPYPFLDILQNRSVER